jgi:hypothetical protein
MDMALVLEVKDMMTVAAAGGEEGAVEVAEAGVVGDRKDLRHLTEMTMARILEAGDPFHPEAVAGDVVVVDQDEIPVKQRTMATLLKEEHRISLVVLAEEAEEVEAEEVGEEDVLGAGAVAEEVAEAVVCVMKTMPMMVLD